MRRREVTTLLGSAGFNWPPVARGQQTERVCASASFPVDESDPEAKRNRSTFVQSPRRAEGGANLRSTIVTEAATEREAFATELAN